MQTESEMHKSCEILGRIAEQYTDDSVELLALQKAAIALQLVHLNKLEAELDKIHDGIGKPLSEDQKEHLRSMGINP
jgi:hypothetical protein